MHHTSEMKVGLLILGAIAIFAYMGFSIGSFRFNTRNYCQYHVYASECAGITRKAEVKIAGVKVGWIEAIQLEHNKSTYPVKFSCMIGKEYALYADARAVVKQDGMLVPRYVELVPGSPEKPLLAPESTLETTCSIGPSLEDVIHACKRISDHVESMTASCAQVLAGPDGSARLNTLIDVITQTSQHVQSCAQIIDRALIGHESQLNTLFDIGNQVQRVAHCIECDMVPALKEQVAHSSQALAKATEPIALIAHKIEEGKGTLGRLVNEDQAYRDITVVASGLRGYLRKIDTMQLVFDNHFESMHRPAENYQHEDVKGFLQIRLHPAPDYFYVIQLSSSERGYAQRKSIQREYFDKDGDAVRKVRLAQTFDTAQFFEERESIFERNALRIGLQFGKIFNRIAVRVGIFENTAGLGIDFDLPVNNSNFRWVTTFEAYEFTGWNRRSDRRPHFKWLNRIFIMRNLYFAFGADDFISKQNANVFFGGGLRFGDDDFKLLLSSIAGSIMGAQGRPL